MSRESLINPDNISSAFIERHGLRVLRQLPIEQPPVNPAEIMATPRGFTISSIPVTEIEQRMRTGQIRPYLREEEGLVPRLATDNAEVSAMGLTHQRLVDFLGYFPQASYELSKSTDSSNRTAGGNPPYFDYQGRTYAFSTSSGRGIHTSPFDNQGIPEAQFTLTCLETGQRIHYSPLRIRHIREFGFYEGAVSTRLGPREIAEMAGFIEPEDNNPVAGLVRDRNAVVALESYDQITRFVNILGAGLDLSDAPNLSLVPTDLNRFMFTVSTLNYGLQNRTGAYIPDEALPMCQRIIDRIDTSNLTPTEIDIVGLQSYLLFSDLFQQFPQLQEIVLANITNIGFVDEHFISQILRELAGKNYPPSETLNPEYLLGLLRKVDLNPTNLVKIYSQAAETISNPRYNPQQAEQDARVLSQLIDSSLPGFREKVIPILQQVGISVTENASIADLLMLKEEWNKRQTFFNEIITLIQQCGAPQDIGAADIIFLTSALQAVRSDSNHSFEKNQLDKLRRLGISPELLSFASWQEGSKPDIRPTIASLYNGSAKVEQKISGLLNSLPEGLDSAARNAVEILIKKRLSSKDPGDEFDIDRFLARLVLEAERRRANETEFTQADVVVEYMSLMLPPFADLIRSATITASLNRWGEPEMELNREVLESISTEGPSSGLYSKPTRIITVGETVYTIGGYNIIVGNASLNLSGDRLATRMHS